MSVFISDTIREERLPFGLGNVQPTSWRGHFKHLSALYADGLRASGYDILSLVRPEIYQSEIARRICGVAAGDWHLAVKPIQDLRPFHGIPNVFVCDWLGVEFSNQEAAFSPFNDHAALLGQADAVICCTSAMTGILQRAGVVAITLPPYIMMPAPKQDAKNDRRAALGGTTRFVTIAEFDRLRWRLELMIEGFAIARARGAPIVLTVFVQGPKVLSPGDVAAEVARQLGRDGIDGSIHFVSVSTLQDQRWTEFAYGAEYFLMCSPTDGLPIALIEAMQAGIVPVATTSIGTTSVLVCGAAIVIETRPVSIDPAGGPLTESLYRTSYLPSAAAIGDAILAAVALDVSERASMADIGRDAMRACFGLEAFRLGIAHLEYDLRHKRS